MNIATFFRQRHQQLHENFLPNLREALSEEDFRTRPVPGTQPIIWLIWHMTRVEDMGLSRFIWDKPQLYNEEWKAKMNTSLNHYGTSMTEEEVAEFAETVNVYAVLDYQQAVNEQTKAELPHLDETKLDEILTEEEVRRIVTDEGMASDKAQWVIPHYVGKSRGWIFCHFGLTHNFRHFGQIALVRKLLKLNS